MTFPREGYSPQGWERKDDGQEESKFDKNKRKERQAGAVTVTHVESISQKYDRLQERIFKSKYNISGRSSLIVVLVATLLFTSSQMLANSYENNSLNKKTPGKVDMTTWSKVAESDSFSAYMKKGELDNKSTARKLSVNIMDSMKHEKKASRSIDMDVSVGERNYKGWCDSKYDEGLDWECLLMDGNIVEDYTIDLKEKGGR
ncbi:hypothetical protein L3H50_08225 [Corynebacterium sp. MC-04]|uniref:Secreted protein n=1 Tax=Corynebacterium parakroppenstedtii TaxID=2828363 RepID=A0ABS9HLK7_9CORY|nr:MULTISPECIES: hypothetical protein [Corynebacterium]KXB49695.1 hypothetical protein HMPREF1861_01640 [Corynebacterium kroppenstedtii]MBY0793427.1 hypothetical protein [Corynebacterium parakroppenstedtii]MCF6770272.1 hypothetical protein [Corynebacterium parakroppenstedtii]MCF6772390.1 hypothetical protein [Corynebacterium parakroppenstedtii]MCF6774692.1 hypothetical protein [Corynebacterium parakroppenstedtii]